MDRDLWLGELWDEWLTFEKKSKAAADLECSGILMGMRKDHSPFTFITNRLRTARRLMKIWPKSSYFEKLKFTPAISLVTQKNRKPYVKIHCPVKNLKLPKNSRSSWAWLKGLWGSVGGLYFPKAGYYLTLIISDEQVAEISRAALNFTGLSWSEHRSEFTIRNHEDITTFLCNAGMPLGALRFDEIVMLRSVRNRVNVERNYEAANIARAVKAAGEQSRLAKKFLSLEGKALPQKLKEVAELRLKFPDDTLEELGARLNPPISKSTVKYRWRKIEEIIF